MLLPEQGWMDGQPGLLSACDSLSEWQQAQIVTKQLKKALLCADGNYSACSEPAVAAFFSYFLFWKCTIDVTANSE